MIVLIVLSTAASLWALHSPSTLFEMSKRFTLNGTVTDVDWVNPHIEVFIDARGGAGPSGGSSRAIHRPGSGGLE